MPHGDNGWRLQAIPERPLSADLADAAQKRLEAPQSDEHATGAVVEPLEYEVQYFNGKKWKTWSKVHETNRRLAIIEFGTQVRGWDHQGYVFRLASRKISPWETALTEEAFNHITRDGREL